MIQPKIFAAQFRNAHSWAVQNLAETLHRNYRYSPEFRTFALNCGRQNLRGAGKQQQQNQKMKLPFRFAIEPHSNPK